MTDQPTAHTTMVTVQTGLVTTGEAPLTDMPVELVKALAGHAPDALRGLGDALRETGVERMDATSLRLIVEPSVEGGGRLALTASIEHPPVDRSPAAAAARIRAQYRGDQLGGDWLTVLAAAEAYGEPGEAGSHPTR